MFGCGGWSVKEQRSVLEDCRDYIDKLCRENAAMVENFGRRDEEAVSYPYCCISFAKLVDSLTYGRGWCIVWVGQFALQEVQTEEIAEKKARIEDLEAQLAQVCLAMLHASNPNELVNVFSQVGVWFLEADSWVADIDWIGWVDETGGATQGRKWWTSRSFTRITRLKCGKS